jgi:hypothetical protein
MHEAVIVSTARTPIGTAFRGTLLDVDPFELGTHVVAESVRRAGIDPQLVDDVVLGCVEPVGEQGADIARVAVLEAGYAETTAGVQVKVIHVHRRLEGARGPLLAPGAGGGGRGPGRSRAVHLYADERAGGPAGELAGHWAVSVSGNWRLTFKFEGEDAIVVDYQDYH